MLSKTKLESGLLEMCLALGVTATTTSYYHFQYPYANGFTIIIDTQDGSGVDSFNLKLPSEFAFYERSWSHRAGEGTETMCGVIPASQLSPDVFHTIEANVYYGGYPSYSKYSRLVVDGEIISEISGYLISEVAIVLIYQEP